MVASLTVAVGQPRTVSGDVVGNAGRHAALVTGSGARVVVFPELSLTGYELASDAVPTDDPRLAPLIEACESTGSIALVGAPVAADGGGTHIAMLAVDGDGAAVVYRKMFLGGDEVGHIVAGERPAVLEVDGWRLGLAICADTGVAEHAAATARLGIDAYVAGVLEHEADRDVQPARAAQVIEDHGVWVAVASFAGSTGGGYDRAAGRSTVWRPDGVVAAAAGPAVDEVVVATLSR